MMDCPKCAGESKVTDSRPALDGVRRRRRCLDCGHKWTTREIAAETHDRLQHRLSNIDGAPDVLRTLAKQIEDAKA